MDSTIASQDELERFATQEDRHLTPELRGVLAETALAGVNRFPFSLIKPVLEQLLEETLKDYEKSQAEEEGSIGPVRPVLDGGVSLTEAINRFRSQIESFNKAPWTIQRLCEILLNPTRQYKKLHKLALAIEKCLMVTGEVGVTPHMPPPPLLASLQHVNDNSKCHDPQPAPHSTDRSRRASSPVKGAVDPDAEDSTAFTNTLMDVRAAPPNSMPANNGHLGFVQYHQQQQQQQQLHSSKAHPHGAGDSSSPMDEDDRWPSTGTAGGSGGSSNNHSYMGHNHVPFPSYPMHQQHQQQQHGSHSGEEGDAVGDAAFSSAVEAAAAAAAAALADSMEIETPVGVVVGAGTEQQQQQLQHKSPPPQQQSESSAGDHPSADTAAAARAIVGPEQPGASADVVSGDGGGGGGGGGGGEGTTAAAAATGTEGSPDTSAKSPVHMQGEMPEGGAAAGSPAATLAGSVERVLETPPSAAKALQDQAGEEAG